MVTYKAQTNYVSLTIKIFSRIATQPLTLDEPILLGLVFRTPDNKYIRYLYSASSSVKESVCTSCPNNQLSEFKMSSDIEFVTRSVIDIHNHFNYGIMKRVSR